MPTFNTTRYALSAALLALLTMAGMSKASAQEVTMNVGWAKPMDSDYGLMVKRFGNLVSEYTDGEVAVKMHCCGQIATEDDAFKALQLGTVDGYIITHNNVAPHWSLMNAFVLPYIFQSPGHAEKITTGEVGETVKRKLREDTGVHLLAFGGVFYRDAYTVDTPVESMADMSGLKYRVPKNQVMIDTIGAFGAEPVPLAWSDTPTALQTGTIDASDNGTSTIKDLKFYDFAENLIILEHFAGFSPLFASERFMNKLSEEHQEAVEKAAEEAGRYNAEYMAEHRDKIRTWLTTEGGMKMYRPDKAAFIEAAKAVQDDFAKDESAEFRQLLSDIRAAAN